MITVEWGSLSFGVDVNRVLPFSDLTRKTSYKTEQKESGKNKPLTIDKGPGLSTISFKAQLISILGVDVDSETAKWHEACEAGKPYPLTIGGERQGKYQWQIKDVSESNVVHDPETVKKIMATLQINFIEYRGAGSATTSSSSGGSSKPSSKPPKEPVNEVPVAVNTTPITQRPPSSRTQGPSNGGSSGLLGG